MTHKFSRNSLLSIVVPFIAILTLLIAADVLAQTSGADRSSGQANAVLAPAGTSASAQAERPLAPWTDGAGRFPVGRSQPKLHGASPMDSGSLLFLFMPVVDYGSGGGYDWSVAVADVNADGKPDIVVTGESSGTVGVLLGNGDGTFQPVATYSSGGVYPWAVAVADVNGDGKLDVVVANYYTGTVGVLLGKGDGTFQPAVTYNAGYEPVGVAIADVNGDGKPDLLVTDQGGSTVAVLLGNGDGTFQPAFTYSLGTELGHSVAVADVNGDGKPDLLLGNTCNDYSGSCEGIKLVGVMLGNGDGTFQPVVSYSSGPAWEYQSSVAVADVNGDGKPDLLATNFDSGSVGVLLGNGDGTFQTAVTYGGCGPYCSSVTAADVNGDGSLDLVAATSTGVVLMLGNEDGTFQPPVNYPSGGSYLGSIVAVDVNGDGKADVVVANTTSSTVGVLLNNSGAPPTTTSLVSSVNPASPLETVVYTATVTSQSGGSVTGTVTFQDGGATIATVPLANNQASYSTSYPRVSAHAITASYWGELHVAFGSASNTLMEYVPGASKTVLTTSGSPSFVGQPVTFTATVKSTYGAIPDGELVTFYDHDGEIAIGTGATASGAATFITSSLTANAHTIEGIYAGGTIFKPSKGTVAQVVDKYPATTALSSSLNPSNYGQAVTLTATVTPTGPYQPTGSVTFKNGSSTLGSRTLNAGGVETLTIAKIPPGVDTLTATYNGDALNAKSVSAAITQTVSQASLSMVLTSTPNPSTFGKSVKFTATLTSTGGLPSGQPVTFSYNNATLGTANVNGKGVATFSTTTLPQGSDVVTAAYAGNVDYSSASATVTQVVN